MNDPLEDAMQEIRKRMLREDYGAAHFSQNGTPQSSCHAGTLIIRKETGGRQGQNAAKPAFWGREGPQTPGRDVTSGELPEHLGSSRPKFSVPPSAAGGSRRQETGAPRELPAKIFGSAFGGRELPDPGARELPYLFLASREHPTTRDFTAGRRPFGPMIQPGAFGPFVSACLLTSWSKPGHKFGTGGVEFLTTLDLNRMQRGRLTPT
ncbi:hypothetical protein C8J57DRAFT_1263901 [Mycena rebaudengoi]|nr:hypothetical protein C8J57DRAFT_1263901 [Mycena rebaudengoi]